MVTKIQRNIICGNGYRIFRTGEFKVIFDTPFARLINNRRNLIDDMLDLHMALACKAHGAAFRNMRFILLPALFFLFCKSCVNVLVPVSIKAPNDTIIIECFISNLLLRPFGR